MRILELPNSPLCTVIVFKVVYFPCLIIKAAVFIAVERNAAPHLRASQLAIVVLY